MKVLALVLVLLLSVSCGESEKPANSHANDTSNQIGQDQQQVIFDLEKLNGASVFVLATNMEKVFKGMTKSQKNSLISEFENRYFFKCENLFCEIQLKSESK